MIWTTANLRLPTTQYHQGDPADQANAAHDRREIDPVLLLMSNLNRPELRIFFLGIPPQSTVGKAEDTHDDKYDADDARGLHRPRVRGVR
jgi:hypothetical protein